MLKLLRHFILFGLFRIHLFGRVLAFICYIEVHVTFGPLDCARYNEDFIISRFVISRSFSIYFTVTLAGLKNIVHYTKDFVIKRFVKARFHCISRYNKQFGCFSTNSLHGGF